MGNGGRQVAAPDEVVAASFDGDATRRCVGHQVLADERFAVVGGVANDRYQQDDGEVFDLVAARAMGTAGWERAWRRGTNALVAVAGGMVAIGGGQDSASELFGTRRAASASARDGCEPRRDRMIVWCQGQ